jgi:hypothetical protein
MYMATVTLYVTDGFKAELEQFKVDVQARVGTSLSEWFQRQVKEQSAKWRKASRKEDGNMDTVVERLKKSDEAEMNQAYESGEEWGSSWAKQHASKRELRRLAKEQPDRLDDLLRSEEIQTFFDDYVHEDHELRALLDGHEDAFARGFVAGAAAVWVAVEDRLS